MGYTKRMMEAEVERLCTCGAGCIFDVMEHEDDCQAVPYLIENFGD